MKLQNSNKLFIVYCLLIAVIVAVISFSLLSPIQKASAEYNDLPSDYIVNFNQLLQFTSATSYVSRVDNSVGLLFASGFNSQFPATLNFNAINGHKYYLFNDNNDGDFRLYLPVGGGITQEFNSIFAPTSNMTITQLFVVNTSLVQLNVNIHFNIIDLTQMYGTGNEPNLSQCKQIFTANYYNYNTGTPMPLSATYMEGYNKGVADTLGSFTYKLNTAAVVNSLQNVDLPGYVGTITRTSTVASINADGTNNNLPTGYLPFLSPIPAGAHFRIGGRLSHNQGNSNVNIGIGVYNNGNMQVLSNNITATGYNGTLGGLIEFDAPVDISGIYIFAYDETSSFRLDIYSLYVEVLNIDYSQLVAAAYQNGYGAGADNYAPGSVGYQSIYQEGYNAGLTNGNTIGSAWDFISGTFSSIGSIFSLEVMPNITLGVFIAIPLLLGLLLFILKVTRG